MPTHRTHHPIAGNLRLNSTFCLVLILLLLMPGVLWAQASAPGLAGDFEIDGNLLANNPGGIIGLGDDWLDGPPGPGIGIGFERVRVTTLPPGPRDFVQAYRGRGRARQQARARARLLQN